ALDAISGGAIVDEPGGGGESAQDHLRWAAQPQRGGAGDMIAVAPPPVTPPAAWARKPGRPLTCPAAMGDTQTKTGVRAKPLYHRWLGWPARAMRRTLAVLIAGLIVNVALLPFIPWGMALVAGWNAASLTFLVTTWPIIIKADSSRAAQLASREDE